MKNYMVLINGVDMLRTCSFLNAGQTAIAFRGLGFHVKLVTHTGEQDENKGIIMKKHLKEIALDLIEKAIINGSVEIRSGVFLDTQENMIANQKQLDDGDDDKDFDYTTADYWMTTDDGQLSSVYDVNDLVEILEKIS